MSFLRFFLLDLIAGAIAQLILLSRQGGGWLITLLLDLIGALLGGFFGGLLFHVGYNGFFSLQSWIIAIVGSLIVLVMYGAITGPRNRA